MQISQMDIINAQIEYGAKGTQNKDITENILNEWRGSETIHNMVEAEKYSKVQNTAIDTKSRSYKDEHGHVIANETLSNVKSKSGQYRKSLLQKLNFALAKPFVISCDNKKYQEEWETFLNDKVRHTIKRVGKNAINKGIGWAYPWIDEKGQLQLLDLMPETIYPAWSDIAHTELDALVRDFEVEQYTNGTKSTIRKVEYWDKEIVEKFIDLGNGQGSGDLVTDPDQEVDTEAEIDENTTILKTHMKKADGEGISWNRVPFIFCKGNDDELSALAECKTDIDSYDSLKSKSIDSLADDIDAVLVVEDISAEMGELAQARKLVQNSRIMAVDKGGNAHFEKVDANIEAIAQQLEMIKKDIQDNTSTVDLTTIKLGTNPSGETMRTYYQPLDTWADGFESEFRILMTNLKYFFDMWLSWRGGFGTFEQLQATKITFSLDRNMLINETAIIDNIVKLRGDLSQQTLDEINPWVESHEIEQQRRNKEQKELEAQADLLLKQNPQGKIDEENEEEDETIIKTKKKQIKDEE